MQLTIEIDDETCAGIEAVARQERSSISSVVKSALGRLPSFKKPPVPVKAGNGYKIPISQGAQPFTMGDVDATEDENDMRGIS